MNKEPRTIRLVYVGVMAMASIVLYIGFLIMTWSFQSDDVIDIKQPIPIIGNKVAKDSVVVLRINYCKNTDAHGDVERKLVGKRGEHLFPAVRDTTGEGCNIVEAPTLLPVLPTGATPGTYHIEYTVTYDLNPLKKGVVEEFKTEEFEVQ